MDNKSAGSSRAGYSHFVSLPLAVHNQLVEKLVKFQGEILGDEKAENNKHLLECRIEKSVFINPKTFHLTVLMLNLWNQERVDAAAAVLQSVSSRVVEALGGRRMSIKLKGLESMSGSLSNARVLYVPIEEAELGSHGRLVQACEIIIDAYTKAGLVLEKDMGKKLRLHATVMNATHRKRPPKGVKKFESFDVRGIVDKYGKKEWGKYVIHEAHLSQRFAYDAAGYYHCCSSIPFP